jgi:hypothetical protein
MLCLGQIRIVRSSRGLVKKGGKIAILGWESWDESEVDNTFSRSCAYLEMGNLALLALRQIPYSTKKSAYGRHTHATPRHVPGQVNEKPTLKEKQTPPSHSCLPQLAKVSPHHLLLSCFKKWIVQYMRY